MKRLRIWLETHAHALAFWGMMIVSGLPLVATRVGPYLDQILFSDVLSVVRARLGLAAHLPAEVRLVVLDDRSLKRLGRPPFFGEWYAVAKQLRDMGFERVLLLDVDDASGRVGLVVPGERPFFATGVVAGDDDRNARTVEASALGAALLVANAAKDAVIPVRTRLIAPHPYVLDHIDRLGSVGLDDDRRGYLAYRLTDGRVLPHLALWAKVSRDGLPAVLAGSVRLLEEPVYFEYPDLGSTFAAAVPVSAFTSAAGEIGATVSEAARRKLAGGKIALLAPQAFTGARFVASPFGQIPAYLTSVAFLASVLRERFLQDVPFGWFVLMVCGIGIGILLRHRSPKANVRMTGLLASLIVGASVLSYATLGWILPCARLLIWLAMLSAVRWALSFVTARAERASLQKDVELGQIVQRTSLGAKIERPVGTRRIEILYRPYGPMAGDWYQTFECGEGDAAVAVVAIGDVVGKGPSAALSTAAIAALWRRHARLWSSSGSVDIEALLQEIDAVLGDTFHGEQYTTLSLVLVANGAARVWTIGAPPWLVYSLRTGEVRRIRSRPTNPLGSGESGTLPLGVDAEVGAEEVLLGATDGYVDGLESRRQLTRLLGERTVAVATADEVIAMLASSLADVGHLTCLPDDRTAVLVLPRHGISVAEQSRSA